MMKYIIFVIIFIGFFGMFKPGEWNVLGGSEYGYFMAFCVISLFTLGAIIRSNTAVRINKNSYFKGFGWVVLFSYLIITLVLLIESEMAIFG